MIVSLLTVNILDISYPLKLIRRSGETVKGSRCAIIRNGSRFERIQPVYPNSQPNAIFARTLLRAKGFFQPVRVSMSPLRNLCGWFPDYVYEYIFREHPTRRKNPTFLERPTVIVTLIAMLHSPSLMFELPVLVWRRA